VPEAYDRPLEVTRRPWQRRLEAYSSKLGRRLTLFSYAAHDAWLLLEADPRVRQFCERPALLEDDGDRPLDFWVDYGRRSAFWQLAGDDGGDSPQRKVFPKTQHGLRLEVLRREDLRARGPRIDNWSAIVPYLVSFRHFGDPRLEQEVYRRLVTPHRLGRLESAYVPTDPSEVRAAVFALLARGKVVAPDLDRTPLGVDTIFRRGRP